MKKKVFSFVVPLLAAYIFLASTDLDKEFIFKPGWVTDLTQVNIVIPENESVVFPFRLRELFGYMDTGGNLLFAERVFHNAAVGRDWYINYSNSPGNLIARDPDGSIVFSIDKAGYPILRDNRLFVISPEGNGISEWDELGSKLWERWFDSVITAIDLSSDYLLVGKLKGEVELIDREGKTIVEYIPENSRIAAVYGCAINETGGQIAILSGIEPQRLTVLERREEEYKIAVSTIMEKEYRRPVFLAFSGKYLFVEGENAIHFLEPPKKWIRSIKTYGRLRSFTYEEEGNLFYIITETDKRSRLQVGMLPGHVLYETDLPGAGMFTRVAEGSLYLSIGYNIMRIDMMEN